MSDIGSDSWNQKSPQFTIKDVGKSVYSLGSILIGIITRYCLW